MTPYIGYSNQVESATVIADDASDFSFVTSRPVEVVGVMDAALTTLEIVTHWGGDIKIISSAAVYGHNTTTAVVPAVSPTVQVRLYDNEVPLSGVLLADSTVQSLTENYLYMSALGLSNQPRQFLYTFTKNELGRLVPETFSVKSIRWNFTFGAAFILEIGSLWGLETVALSPLAELGKEESPNTIVFSKITRTQNAGVASQDDTNIDSMGLGFPILSGGDKATMIDLSKRVGDSNPFFLHKYPGLSQQLSRADEGGIVRFTPKGIKVNHLGKEKNGVDLYEMPSVALTAWR